MIICPDADTGTLFLARRLVRVHIKLAPEVTEIMAIAPKYAPSPAVVVMAFATRRERAVFAWKYEFPPLVFADIASAGTLPRMCPPAKAVVVTITL